MALGMNILLILAAMALVGATLTLPGIAGIALTIGIAIDANVLIYERIREELRLGKTPRAAVDKRVQPDIAGRQRHEPDRGTGSLPVRDRPGEGFCGHTQRGPAGVDRTRDNAASVDFESHARNFAAQLPAVEGMARRAQRSDFARTTKSRRDCVGGHAGREKYGADAGRDEEARGADGLRRADGHADVFQGWIWKPSCAVGRGAGADRFMAAPELGYRPWRMSAYMNPRFEGRRALTAIAF